MPRTMPSGAERVQPMPLTRIIISLLFFFFILVNLGIIWGRGEWEKARHGGRPGDLRPPRLRGGTGGPVPGRSPQPDPELFSLPRFYFLKFLIFYFIPVPDFPGGRWGRPPRSAPGCGRAGRSWQRPAVLGRGVGRRIRPGKIPIPATGFFWGVRSGTASCRPPHAQPCPAPSSLRFWGLERKKGKRRLTKGGCVSGSTAGFSPPGSGKASPRLGHPISPSGPVGAFTGTRAGGALPCPAAAAARQRGERRRLAKPLGVYYRGLTTAFPL